MEIWKMVWRKAVVQLASLEGLTALRDALAADSDKLIQGATTQPPPLQAVQDWPVEASDAISYLFWQGKDATVGDVEEFFARTCYEVDQIMGEPAACRHWLNWYDETPRGEMIEELLPEVDLAICRKKDMGG